MKRLLIDIGNTRMKGCIADGRKLGKIHSKEYAKHSFADEYSAFLSVFNPDTGESFLKNQFEYNYENVYLSLLNTEVNAQISFLTPGFNPVFINTQMPLPIGIDYTHTLGSDRICSAVGAFTKFKDKNNILIIDFGTATTFNVVSDGLYKGGMISTGIKTTADALIDKTTLPNVLLKPDVKLINNDTDNAIISGLVLQQVLFVEKAIEEYRKLFTDLYVVATGGGIELMKKHKTGIDKFEPDLVLEGLNHIAIYNETIRKK
ncbi:MAG: type III pantothenate kinase [Ignavibacteriota bacterium]